MDINTDAQTHIHTNKYIYIPSIFKYIYVVILNTPDNIKI